MMKLNRNEFLGLVYSDIFDFPLKREEASLWQLNLQNQRLNRDKNGYERFLETDGEYFYLKRRKGIVELRKKREIISRDKFKRAEKVRDALEKVPTVRGVFLTGSLAVSNAPSAADIDLMVITAPGVMWLSRLVVVSYLKLRGIYRGKKGDQVDKICTNIWLDEDHLKIKQKNLYTAHEILQVKVLFDRGGVYGTWLRENKWTGRYLPKAYQYQISNINPSTSLRARDQKYKPKVKKLGWLWPVEEMVYRVQFWYMKPKVTNEKVSRGQAFFHPRDLSEEVIQKFNQGVVKFTGYAK